MKLQMVFIVWLFYANGFCQFNINIDKHALDDYLVIAESMGVNAQILLAKNNRIAYQNSIGHLSENSSVKVNDKTVFGIASITKQFTAAAICLLVQERKIGFDSKLLDFFKNTSQDKEDITIHQLLTHTSGLKGGDIIDDFEEISKQELISKIMISELASRPGEKWEYSNAGYNILARIIETVCECDYEEFLNSHFFFPLRMKYTGVIGGKTPNYQDGNAASAQRGFVNNGSIEIWSYNMRTLGSGNIYSTVEDLFIWNKAISEYKILSPEITETFLQPHFKINKNDSYGYGWFHYGDSKLGKVIEHGGDTYLGYNGGFYQFPESDISLFILMNKFETVGADLWSRWSIYYGIKKILIGSQVKDLFEYTNTVNPLSGLNVTIKKDERLKESFFLEPLDLNSTVKIFEIDAEKLPSIIEINEKFKNDYKAVETSKRIVNLLSEILKNSNEEILMSELYDSNMNILGILPNYFNNKIEVYTCFELFDDKIYLTYTYNRNEIQSIRATTTNELGKWFLFKENKLVNYNLWTNKKSIINLPYKNYKIEFESFKIN